MVVHTYCRRKTINLSEKMMVNFSASNSIEVRTHCKVVNPKHETWKHLLQSYLHILYGLCTFRLMQTSFYTYSSIQILIHITLICILKDGSLGCKTLKILLQNMLAKLLLIRLIFNPDIRSSQAFYDGRKALVDQAQFVKHIYTH